MISDSLLQKCHSLALRIAPELESKPLHLLDAAQLPDYPRNKSCLLGWAQPGFYEDHIVADAIGDNYAGCGATICLDGDAIAEAAEPGQFERCLLNVLVHETGHLLPPVLPIVDLPPTPTIREWQLARMQDMLTGSAAVPGTTDDCHALDFIRRTLHLFVRATAAGFNVALDGLFSSHPWSTHTHHWLPLVLSEALQMRDKTFEQIEATEPPPALVDLWQADLDRYRHFQNKEKVS